MKVWYRSAAVAAGALLWLGTHAGAQIRETVGLPPAPSQRAGITERPNHPVVLLNSREGEFTGGERIVTQFMFQRLDPAQVVEKAAPPKGIDGLIAYPGSRTLMVRGMREAVASYRDTLEKLDRATGGARGEIGPAAAGSGAASAGPVILLPAGEKLRLRADRVTQEGAVTQASGHVVIGLANGIELRARAVRVSPAGGRREIVIEQ